MSLWGQFLVQAIICLCIHTHTHNHMHTAFMQHTQRDLYKWTQLGTASLPKPVLSSGRSQMTSSRGNSPVCTAAALQAKEVLASGYGEC